MVVNWCVRRGHPLPTEKWIYCFIKRILMKIKEETIDLKTNSPLLAPQEVSDRGSRGH